MDTSTQQCLYHLSLRHSAMIRTMGGPEHGLEEAVGAPDGGDDLHSGDEGHCQVAGADSGQSGEDHELGLHFVPQEAADYLAQAIA